MAIIARGDWWTLDDEGLLSIFCEGDMPDYSSNADAPWYGNRRVVKDVTFANSVTSIGDRAFVGAKISAIIIPDNIINVGLYALGSNYSLKNVTISTNLVSIDKDAFLYCPRITDVYYRGTDAQWNQIAIETGNSNLTSATIHYNFYPSNALNYSGLSVMAFLSDGTEIDVTSECTFDPPEGTEISSVPCTIPVTATYTQNEKTFTTVFDLRVEYRTHIISVTSWPTKTVYSIGDTFDTTGLVVKKIFSDGTETDITSECTVAPHGGETIQTAGTIIFSVYKDSMLAKLIDDIEMVALSDEQEEHIIQRGDWWTLDENGEVRIYYAGNMITGLSGPQIYPWVPYNPTTGKGMGVAYTVTKITTENNVTGLAIEGNYDTYWGRPVPDYRNLQEIFISANVLNFDKPDFRPPHDGNGYTVEAGNQKYCSVDGHLFSADKSVLIQHVNKNTETPESYQVPVGTIEIGARSFSGGVYTMGTPYVQPWPTHGNLQSVTFPNGLEIIGRQSFCGVGIQTLQIPDSVTSVEDDAFSFCTNLEQAVLSDSLTAIKYCTFRECTKLARIYIPKSVIEIEYGALPQNYTGTSQREIYYSGTPEQWSAITINSDDNGNNYLFINAATIHYNSGKPT